MSRAEEIFEPALTGKNVPVLTLDNKWHKLFDGVIKPKDIEKLEKDLNNLVKRQGKLNTEIKEMRKLKAQLMQTIVGNMDAIEQADVATDKKLSEQTRLIDEINEKMAAYADELLDLPKQMDGINHQLMVRTMEICYQLLQDNKRQVAAIEVWIAAIRRELKKNIVKKQECEAKNESIYAYMHDIFGPEVMEIFDINMEEMDKEKES